MTAAAEYRPRYEVSSDDAVDATLYESSLFDFVRHFWPHIESQDYVNSWHIEMIADHLEAVTRGQIKNLLINIPPGCSKSLLCCVFWPCWVWVSDPSSRWFFASYDQRLSTRDSVKCRILIRSHEYQRLWGRRSYQSSRGTDTGFRITHDQNQKTYYETSLGGYRLATSIGGHGTGQHPDFVVIDDPLSAKEAESEVERQSVIDWWDLTMSTRGVSRGVRKVIIMQRLHQDDLAGHVLRTNDEFVHICLPMRYEPGRMVTTPLGWNDKRSVEGELLTPNQFPEESVRKMEKALGAYGTAGQLQQRPRPKGGGMFKVQWFNQRAKSAPYNARRIRFWDRACLIENTLVETDRGPVPIQDVVAGDMVLTRQGYKEVTWSGKTKDVGEVTTVEFSNGSRLSGTFDHPVWTENRGWCNIDSINSGDCCLHIPEWSVPCERRKGLPENQALRRLSLTELLTPGGRASGTLKPTGGTSYTRDFGPTPSTGQFGGITTGTSLLGTTSTTRTVIGTTTPLRTWIVSPARSTTKSTTRLPLGTPRKRRKFSGEGTARRLGTTPRTRTTFANNAASSSSPGELTNPPSIAPPCAGTGSASRSRRGSASFALRSSTEGPGQSVAPPCAQTCSGPRAVRGAVRSSSGSRPRKSAAARVAARGGSGKIPVYDLTVRDAHEFFANGILVHNSTHEGGCYTAGVLMAQDSEGRYYVEDVVHGQWEPDERNQVMRSTALRDRSRYGPNHEPEIYVEAEGGSSGVDAWKGVQRALTGFRVMQDRPTGSKDVRAEPWSSELAAGNVWLIDNGEHDGSGKASWDINGYVNEHLMFRPAPGKRVGKYADQIDSSSGAYNLFAGAKRVQPLRVYTFSRKTNQVRFLVCSKEELATLILDTDKCLLVSISDPGEPPDPPTHGIRHLLDTHRMQFADVDLKDHQTSWDELIAPFDRPAKEICVTPEMGRDLWKFLLKKRDKPYEVVVIQGSGDRRALSVAFGLADTLRIPRKSCVYLAQESDIDVETLPRNQYVIDQIKASRERLVT